MFPAGDLHILPLFAIPFLVEEKEGSAMPTLATSRLS